MKGSHLREQLVCRTEIQADLAKHCLQTGGVCIANTYVHVMELLHSTRSCSTYTYRYYLFSNPCLCLLLIELLTLGIELIQLT